MKLEDAVSDLNRRFSGRAGIPYVACETGDVYVSIGCGGPLTEGEYHPAICGTPEIAVALWHQSVLKYAEDKSGVLYWNCDPEVGDFCLYSDQSFSRDVNVFLFERRKYYAVYSRLVITDKPVLSTVAVPA